MEIKKVSESDSIEVSKAFQKFINIIETKNKAEFLKSVLNKIDCINCDRKSGDFNTLVSKQTMFDVEFKNFEKSPVYIALKKRGFYNTRQ